MLFQISNIPSARDFIFDIPILGKHLFLKEVRKIVTCAGWKNVHYAHGFGGIRPQIVNVSEKKLDFGTAEIIGDNIIFNITPSPGASTCLKNAENDTKTIIKMLGTKYKFDLDKFERDYK